jgi:prepilin-type N-terminal cleavage/methylation domain-containing protein
VIFMNGLLNKIPHARPAPRRRPGLTLIELVIVVAILAIVAGFIIPSAAFFEKRAKITATKASLTAIRDAIVGTANAPGFYGDTGQYPNTLQDLFVDPFPSTSPLYTFNRDTGRGWRGPYLLNANGTYPAYANGFLGPTSPIPYGTTGNPANYGTTGDSAIIDAWGNAIILQWPTSGTLTQNQSFIRLVSAGPNGVIDTPQDYAGTTTGTPWYPPANVRGDDIVLFINHADSYSP